VEFTMLIANLVFCVVGVVAMPEPDNIAMFAVYAAGLGLFGWYQHRRTKRSKS
jgi:hypothetical protein